MAPPTEILGYENGEAESGGEIGSGKWVVGIGKWNLGSVEWDLGSGKWGMGGGKWEN